MSSAIPQSDERDAWYDETRRHTLALVRLRSVSPSQQENAVGAAILH